MKFTKTNDIYKIVRITGGYDNILGVCFTQKDNGNNWMGSKKYRDH